MSIQVPGRLSYSSLSSYAECGERWRLERGHKLNASTWFATVAGSAVHEITEAHDLVEIGRRSDAVPEFKPVFDGLLAKERELGREVKPSGKKLKKIGPGGGPNKRDYDWWLIYGPLYVEKWLAWKAASDWKIAILPDGEVGVEVVINEDMADESFLGFIDRVYITPDGQVVIVDLKTGSVPMSTLQLGSYAVGLSRKYGISAEWGAYWMAGDGELTGLKDLTIYSDEYIDEQYAMAWRGIRNGVFLPNITALCRGCGVRDFCRAVGGMRSNELPIRDDLILSPPVTQATESQVVQVSPGV
ncbi:PD-(D/E)XK nuclease family protein [Umezawaea sp. Da 62-37]|uniref:RecB family exonuclease n=1 Tax=Umezawaea sp. Da 62-37 TaxID=3075927 RepID=UPI0028F704E4|nr:PD-(D/E)XK nuclease family protein [Umezawaea sp. Da 62-37]WNV90327.1 PD-(D/E)XK nuclease family protein [Umezawaea sp. Da 62-37]